MPLVSKGNKLIMRAVPSARIFVPETIYYQRRINFLKNAIFTAKRNARLILGFAFNENLIYEFRLESKSLNMAMWDFLLPLFRIKGRGLYFDQFSFFAKAPHHNTKK